MEDASDDFPQQKKLENLLPNFAGSSPPISPKTSPTSLWKSLVLRFSEGVSTGVWCVPGFGAGFEFALEPSKLQKEGENPGKGHF